MKVVEEGQKSQKKRDHLTLALKKLHCELLTMDDGSDEIENDDDLEAATLVEATSQVLSNIPFTLHDPPHVVSRGRATQIS
ncbi:hypothetical protein RHGRI_033848 [Rhododendron griersonianum]|uniref:Uncharacterized protein n=1 Tax=Rhododendron griersonianum TaxID=479676 RepID=A0AAV6HYC3_9ERIC|nr:hypothetical protein RHGRI_033848 [Rhododendron griersonianum]